MDWEIPGCLVNKNNIPLYILLTVVVITLGLLMGFQMAAAIVVFIILGVMVQNAQGRILLLIISLPLEVVSYYYGFTIKLWMIVLALSVIITCIGYVLKRREFDKSILTHLLLILLVVNLISIFHAVNIGRWMKMIIQYSILYVLASYVSIVINSRDRLKWAIRSMMFSGTAISIYGIGQWIGALYGYDVKLPLERMPIYSQDMYVHLVTWAVIIGDTWVPRIRGTFPDPTLFGGFALSFCPLIISLTCYKIADRRDFVLYAVLSVIAIIAVIGTFSRSILGGFMIEIALLALFWWKLFRKKRVLRIVIAGVILYIALLFTLPGKLTRIINPVLHISRIGQTMVVSDESTGHHKELAEAAMRIWKKYPLIGAGFGNFGSELGGVENALSHSAFLSFLAETGIIGFFANVLLVGCLIAISCRTIRRSPVDSYWFAVNVGILISFIGTVSGNITYHYYNQPYIWFLMGLIIALSKYGFDAQETYSPANAKI